MIATEKLAQLFSLEGKVAVITGGNNGLLGPIWKETVTMAGGDVFVIDKLRYDVSDRWSVGNAHLDFHTEWAWKYPAPSIIINNAAIDNPPGSSASFFGSFEEILKVNLAGAVNVVQEFLPGMIANGGGVIVNIGSIQGWGGADYTNYPDGWEKPFGYNASKWALRGLSKSLTIQYGKYNIRSVTPSFGPYNGGKLSEEFLTKFMRRVPLERTISKESLQTTLLYACCCPELAGADWLVDAGRLAWA